MCSLWTSVAMSNSKRNRASPNAQTLARVNSGTRLMRGHHCDMSSSSCHSGLISLSHSGSFHSIGGGSYV